MVKRISIIAAALLLVIGLTVLLLGVSPYIVGSSYESSRLSTVDVATKKQLHEVIDWEENSNAEAWIYVPGTGIDYPIVHAPKDNPQYYLSHDKWNNYSIHGCPYLDSETTFDSYAPYIYGHNMIDQTMFSDFEYMTDYSFAESHQTIYLLTPTETRELQIIGVRSVNANKETIKTGFSSSESMRTWFEPKIEACDVRLGEIAESVQVYTFVTCSYNSFINERTLIYAIEER